MDQSGMESSGVGIVGSLLRPDQMLAQERRQALVRLVVGPVIWVYGALVATHLGRAPTLSFYLALSGFFVLAVILLAATRVWPPLSILRQVLAALLDVASITYLAVYAGGFGATLFILHLLVSIDAGNRFGMRALVVNTLLGITGFGITVLLTSFWIQQWPIALGIFAMLAAVPLYVVFAMRIPAAPALSGTSTAAMMSLGDAMLVALQRVQENIAVLLASSKRRSQERKPLATIRELVSSSMQQWKSFGARPDVDVRSRGSIATESFDLIQVLRHAGEMTTTEVGKTVTAAAIRVDPHLPQRLTGDRVPLQQLLTALLSLQPGGRSRRVMNLEAGTREGSSLQVRFELRCLLEGGLDPARTEATMIVIEWFAKRLGGHVEPQRCDGRWLVFAGEIPLGIAADEATLLQDLVGARLLLIAEHEQYAQAIAGVLPATSLQVTAVTRLEEAVGALAQGIRTGNPVRAILIEAAMAFGNDGQHRATDFCQKAAVAGIPVYLLTANPPAKSVIRAHDYAGTIEAPTVMLLARALRASIPEHAQTNSTGVVRIEPWAWKEREVGPARRILIVDDNKTNLLIVESILNAAGYQVDALKSAEEALQRLVDGGYRLAILDLHMPGMNGTTLLRRYRTLCSRGRVPIVFLTANTSMDAIQECADAGADAFLTKPVRRDVLLSTVETLLHDHEVHLLVGANFDGDEGGLEAGSLPLLNMDALRELTRLYDDQNSNTGIVGEFRTEVDALLSQMDTAVTEGDHPLFTDLVYALRASAANVGAAALAAACHDAGALGLIEFRRSGDEALKHIRELCQASLAAMETEITATDRQ